ncbi:MAG: hypothetical protein RMK99_11155 [Anaerolineales bacterium]|nr:hypothetical protein [Anaerolineales bacterium]
MFTALANRLETHAPSRYLFLLVVTLAGILVIGYHFGTFDQFAHLPFLKKYADPALYPGDAFIELRRESYSYFWLLFVPALRAGVLEPVMLAVHVAATYATFWLLWKLSRLLFASPEAALLSTLAFVMPHIGFGGFPVFEFSLLNRTFTLPFALWAVYLYLSGRPVPAFLLAGLLFNLHVITVNFVMAMFLTDLGLRLLARLRAGVTQRSLLAGGELRTLLFGLPLFLLGAAPVLLWRLTSPTRNAAVNPEWFDVMARGSLTNLFYILSPHLHILFATLSGVGTLAMVFIARRAAPARSAEHERSVLHFMIAVMLVVVVQAVTVLVWPIDLLNQLQVVRIGSWSLIFGYLYFAAYLVRRWESRENVTRADNVVLTATYVATFLPFQPVLVWAIERLLPHGRLRTALTTLLSLGLFAFALTIALNLGLWSPGLYPLGPDTAWEQIQLCARERTPADALFITPPEKWWLYGSDWRTFSERATLATHSELLMIALVPTHYDHWKERFVRLAPGAIERFNGNFFENQRIVKEAFYSLTPAELLRVAADYNVDYIVLQQPYLLDLPALDCSNSEYSIYRVR